MALWQLTPDSQALLVHSDWPRLASHLPRQRRRLIATYELLGALVAGLSASGGRVTLRAWEAPWQRVVSIRSSVRTLQLPAGAVLAASAGATGRLSALLLPDLGWASVGLHRRILSSMIALRTAWEGDIFPTLVVATVAAPGRVDAWLDLIGGVADELGEAPLSVLVVTWSEVRERRLGSVLTSGAGTRQLDHHLPRVPREAASRAVRAPTPAVRPAVTDVGEEGVLHVLGRHPFLPIAHLAALLGVRVRDARARLARLAAAGLLRWVGAQGDQEQLALGLAREELAALELSELTREGLRELAASLGLPLARAERLHGLVGGGPAQPTSTRRSLVRALAHTLGVDGVFVALHVALSGTRGAGLVRWDNAAAAMRGRCRPDGYGVCRHDGRDMGFFLEYDRGTEKARDYAGKWAAYHAYRDSGRAAREYTSFPTIVVVTAGSEEPVLRSARGAAIGRAPLRILVTTTGWITDHSQGILGPIWRTPESTHRCCWLPRPAIAGARPVPRLVWPT